MFHMERRSRNTIIIIIIISFQVQSMFVNDFTESQVPHFSIVATHSLKSLPAMAS